MLCIPDPLATHDNLLAKQVITALITGNAIIILAKPDHHPELAELEHFLNEKTECRALLSFGQNHRPGNWFNANIAAALHDGRGLPDLANQLMLRDGPIIPILSAHDAFTRYLIERTVSIDTTAAGGNASLLAM